jgi:hypothetical protein
MGMRFGHTHLLRRITSDLERDFNLRTSPKTNMVPENTVNRSFSLVKYGIYKTLKYLLRTAAKRDITALKREYKVVKAVLDRASKRADVQEVARLQIEVRRLDGDAKVAQQRLAFSTH